MKEYIHMYRYTSTYIYDIPDLKTLNKKYFQKLNLVMKSYIKYTNQQKHIIPS